MPRRDPAGFTSSAKRPSDFDSFWADTLSLLGSVPPNPTFTRDELRSDEDVDVFDVRYDSFGGMRIAGWYVRPAGRSTVMPGLLTVPGYVSEPKVPKEWARLGYATFSAAPRGKLRSNDVFNPGYPGLLMHNATDRDSYAYRGFYMDALRAFDILSAMPEVDSRRIGVTGSSQGGALTLLVAALRPNSVAVAAAGAPYLCSFMDSARLTHSYPYQEINDFLRLHPEQEEDIRGVFDYFDIHHFAPSVKAPIVVNIGLQDDVCPPETGFAVFGRIGSSDKKLYPYDKCGHDAGSFAGHEEIIQEFLELHLKPAPVVGKTFAVSVGQTIANTESFGEYWDEVDNSVKGLRVSGASLDPLPLRSTEGSTTRTVKLPSIGEGEVFGYFSVPNGDGPFPGLLEAPGYGSVVHLSPYRRRQKYAVLTLVHRGQRLADENFATAYPGLLTDGVEDPSSYKYRGIVADVLTGLDWLAGRPEIDAANLGVAGSEVGLMAASLRSDAVKAVLLSGPLIFRTASGCNQWPDYYPFEELNDFVRANSDSAEDVSRTLSFFDPLRFAPGYSGVALVACPEWDKNVASPLVSRIGGECELYLNTGRGRADHTYTETWLDNQLTGQLE
ncbi:MAG: prolyl oligopeptidase family serine peptidase [Chloroflexi bacterium]|nr:prolyl oligopeptidase family serine peptidase [Chloroflexota bacterium]MBT6681787.1 prolyl oligopeptidase family serine peptidase [Chloroflexota bacterium]